MMIFSLCRKQKISALFVAASLAVPGAALAQTCAGVEARVNVATSSLQASVTAHIATNTQTMVLQEQLARQRIMGAMHVLVRQDALTSEQIANADRAASEALANVIIEQSVNDQLRQVVTDYGSTGHNACGLIDSGRNVAAMVQAYGSSREAMAESIRESRNATTDEEFRQNLASWNRLVGSADDATVASLLAGDEDAARAFISIVAGPPRPPRDPGSGSIASQQDRVLALRDDARNSAAVLVLSDIAASQQLRGAMEEMSENWIGDGGNEWAARMATQPSRAVLLDTARIEAQNIALAALELRQQSMEEFALSVFALSYVDDLAARPGLAAGGNQQ